MTALAGFPAKFFGNGDPVARVPFADITGPNRDGVPIRTSGCGYWETGVKPELSRDVSVHVTQGDPAKPGAWSADVAHKQYAVILSLAADSNPQAITGLGDEAFGKTAGGQARLVVRAGDLVIDVECDAPPDTTVLSIDALKAIAQAVLAKV
jgi:hypothetical protein